LHTQQRACARTVAAIRLSPAVMRELSKIKSTYHQVRRLLAIFVRDFAPSCYVRVGRDGAAHAVVEDDGLWLVALGDMVCADQNWALRKRGI
jgi:hypothetical protein